MKKLNEIKETLNKISLKPKTDDLVDKKNKDSIEPTRQNIISSKNQELIELNIKLSNSIYSSTQLLADKLCIDWERVRKYYSDDLKDFQQTISKISDISKNYYQLIANFDDLKFNGNDLPDINVEDCKSYLKKNKLNSN